GPRLSPHNDEVPFGVAVERAGELAASRVAVDLELPSQRSPQPVEPPTEKAVPTAVLPKTLPDRDESPAGSGRNPCAVLGARRVGVQPKVGAGRHLGEAQRRKQHQEDAELANAHGRLRSWTQPASRHDSGGAPTSVWRAWSVMHGSVSLELRQSPKTGPRHRREAPGAWRPSARRLAVGARRFQLGFQARHA